MGEFDVPCDLCGELVDPLADTTWQRIDGFQRMAGVRASGKHGGSDIALRRTVDGFAHNHCIVLRRAGIAPEQVSLV